MVTHPCGGHIRLWLIWRSRDSTRALRHRLSPKIVPVYHHTGKSLFGRVYRVGWPTLFVFYGLVDGRVNWYFCVLDLPSHSLADFGFRLIGRVKSCFGVLISGLIDRVKSSVRDLHVFAA